MLRENYEIILGFSKARLLYLENDDKSVGIYRQQIQRLDGIPEYNEYIQYYAEYICAISLVLNTNYDEWYHEIEKYAIIAINNILEQLVENSEIIFSRRANEYDYEKIIESLLLNIDIVNDEEIRRKLFVLLWNILIFKFSTINLSRNYGKAVDIGKNHLSVSDFIEPTQQSLFYFLFMQPEKNIRNLLVCSYDTIKFEYQWHEYSTDVESQIHKIINDGLKDEVTHLLDNENINPHCSKTHQKC
jgi:hypothetical protein